MKRSTLIFGLVALLVVGAAAAWKFLPHALSYDECSPVYRHFADMQMEGVRITYIKDKIINDTLRLPVTLIEAETDRAWERIDSLFGMAAHRKEIQDNPDIPDDIKESLLMASAGFSLFYSHVETPELRNKAGRCHPDDLNIFFFPSGHRVCIFESVNGDSHIDALMDAACDEVFPEDN